MPPAFPTRYDDNWEWSSTRRYCEKPRESMQRLSILWNKHKGKGSIISDESELNAMMCALSGFFAKDHGQALVDDKVVGELKGRLWDTVVSIELPLLLSEMIKDEAFMKQSQIWTTVVIHTLGGLCWVWHQHAPPEGSRYRFDLSWKTFPTSMAKTFFDGLVPVWDILWRNKDTLLQDERKQNYAQLIRLTHFVMSLLKNHYQGKEYRASLSQSPSIVGISLASWTHAAQQGANHEHQCAQGDCSGLHSHQHSMAFDTVTEYLDCVEGADMQLRAVDMALEAIGPSTFMKTIHEVLSSWPDMVGSALKSCLELLGYMILFDNELRNDRSLAHSAIARRAYCEQPGMLEAVLKALERDSQPVKASDWWLHGPGSRARVFTGVLNLVSFTMRSSVLDGDHPPEVNGRVVYEVVAKNMLYLGHTLAPGYTEPSGWLQMSRKTDGPKAAALDAARAQYTRHAVDHFTLSMGSWSHQFYGDIFANMGMSYRELKQNERRVVEEVREAARETWYTNMNALLALRGRHGLEQNFFAWGESIASLVASTRSPEQNHANLVEAWKRFGSSAGFTVEEWGPLYEAGRKFRCSWATCGSHRQEPSPQLRACAGCRERHYCSVECQKKDWKEGGHKRRCKMPTVPA